MTVPAVAPPSPQPGAAPSPGAPTSSAAASAAASNAASREDLMRAAREFESMVLGQLLQPMFAALDTEGLGGGGLGEELYRPMLVNEYAAHLARHGGVGLASFLVEELTRMQAASAENAPSTPGETHGASR